MGDLHSVWKFSTSSFVYIFCLGKESTWSWSVTLDLLDVMTFSETQLVIYIINKCRKIECVVHCTIFLLFCKLIIIKLSSFFLIAFCVLWVGNRIDLVLVLWSWNWPTSFICALPHPPSPFTFHLCPRHFPTWAWLEKTDLYLDKIVMMF